jgi:hypothetical protein
MNRTSSRPSRGVSLVFLRSLWLIVGVTAACATGVYSSEDPAGPQSENPSPADIAATPASTRADAAHLGDSESAMPDAAVPADTGANAPDAGTSTGDAATFMDAQGDAEALADARGDAASAPDTGSVLNACGLCDRTWSCNSIPDLWSTRGADCVNTRTGTALHCDGTFGQGGSYAPANGLEMPAI